MLVTLNSGTSTPEATSTANLPERATAGVEHVSVDEETNTATLGAGATSSVEESVVLRKKHQRNEAELRNEEPIKVSCVPPDRGPDVG